MNWLENLIRPDLRSIAPYCSARSEGDPHPIGIDANEFPWPPFGSTQCQSNRYPQPQPRELIQRLAALWNVGQDCILLTRGSDEGIDTLLRLFCCAGRDQILICPPTYGMYKTAAAVQGAAVLEVPLTPGWQLDVATISATCTPATKLIIIPSPNAPMGHLMSRADILVLCMARAGQSLIVVDEAYVEFTSGPEGVLPDLANCANLVVLRTLSKAHALAGERIGAVIAAPPMIGNLRKILAPYPLTQSSIRIALDALGPNGLVQNAERRSLLLAERERMAALLPKSPWIESVFASVANFLLVKTSSSEALVGHLKKFGILARDRNQDVPWTVRLTIGTPEENNLVLQVLGIDVAQPAGPLQRLFSSARRTNETTIAVTVNLDAPRFLKIDTGIGFFDHMLSQLALHGGFGLELHCKGDLAIDQHHTIEDCALALGDAMKDVLGDKAGIARFGFTAPLDEALAQVAVDLSGRSHLVFNGVLPAERIGEMSTEMVPHFFRSLATALGATIHIRVEGANTHHMTEAIFKATGRALRQAFRREEHADIPSTKGVL
ncbi:MAG TPA: histidinol-phosphate transaminase [Rhizomicrobium sp.]|jgi:histidinol-phosphate aminotransferase/imidazoleglycerol-phosphate dehydratase/histidinol-phosphatase|nr:histidinol-phosphate transaminase [Rhizomicrobium sp.]